MLFCKVANKYEELQAENQRLQLIIDGAKLQITILQEELELRDMKLKEANASDTSKPFKSFKNINGI